MNDPSKHVERAEKYLEKGKPELALEEFRSAFELQPRNQQILQKIADLSLSIGQLGLAADMLRRLFAILVESKQISEAALVFRKLQRIRALDPEMVSRYAELCASTNRKDAAEAFRLAFQDFQRVGEPRRALECISSALLLEPRVDDYREQARIAEALHERVLAAQALVNLGIILERGGMDASESYARAHANDTSNMAARLGHGRALIAKGHPEEAIELLRPLATYPSSPEEAREPYARALLAVGRVEEAEPFAWGLFERNPAANLATIHSVIGGLVDRDRPDSALGLARRLEEFYRKAGRRIEFMHDMAQVADRSKPSIPFSEYLAALYNSANRETDYAQQLSHLFQLYFAEGNFSKALDALDRAVDIDPYEAEHKQRMLQLVGHAPEDRLQTVAKRIGIDAPAPTAAPPGEEETPVITAPSVFEDLILQAEIFLQYGMREQAMEKIDQLKTSFAADLENNPRVRQLFLNAGLPVSGFREEPVEQKRTSESMERAAEISRLIARQGDPRSVLVTAVNQIGARWHYSRCVAALATPGKPPSLVVEYCSQEVPKSERAAMVRLLALSQRLTSKEHVFHSADVRVSEALLPIRNELARLDVHSLAIFALLNEDKPIGLFIVQQCGVSRRWSPDDVTLLGSLVDQVALAIHGARLRSLVSTLGVAEEETGLLKRSSYIDAVLAELNRHRAGEEFQSTLALLQVTSLTSEVQAEHAVGELVRTLRALAQDQAMLFRYDRDTVAMLLPQLGGAETEAVVGQLREALAPIALAVSAGIAQTGPITGFEAEDAATEWINRVANALTLAATLPDRMCTLPPTSASISE